ncbi:MAG: peptidylprolyl isomerase [Patescibacteria group bacterium]
MKEKVRASIKTVGDFLSRIFFHIRVRILKKRGGEIDIIIDPNKVPISKRIFTGLFYLILLVGLIETVIAVMIYGFQREDKATKAVADVVPYPTAVTSFGFVSYGDYLSEKAYIHHFYDSTQQKDVAYEEIDKQILDQLIENRLISYEAFRYGVKVKKDEVNQTFSAISDQNGGDEKVGKVLEDLYGLNIKSFKKLVKEQLLRDKINNELIARVTAKHILARVDKSAPQDQVDAAKTKIDAILAEVRGGADFTETAKSKSEDIGSAEQGGELEPFAKGEMVEPFSEVAFSTSAGQISDPVRTDFGWHIIKVESRTGKIEMTFTDWLDSLKKNGLIWKLIK